MPPAVAAGGASGAVLPLAAGVFAAELAFGGAAAAASGHIPGATRSVRPRMRSQTKALFSVGLFMVRLIGFRSETCPAIVPELWWGRGRPINRRRCALLQGRCRQLGRAGDQPPRRLGSARGGHDTCRSPA